MIEEKESKFKIKTDLGLVDFLGALFPGLLFSITIVFTLGSTYFYIIHQLKTILLKANVGIEDLNVFESLRGLFNGIGYVSFYLLILILVVSYVLGSFLFRKDPKYPDTASFKRVFKKMTTEQKSKWVEQYTEDDKKNQDFVIEFPYRNLKAYLDARGLQHLSKFVPWDINNSDTRSKTFINRLKIRIQFFYPDKTGNILKNEGHIRLMSSLWYLCKYLKTLSLLCLTTNLLTFFSGLYLYWNYTTIFYFIISAFISAFILLFATYGKKIIETFIHYQRVREIFYVLETAYTTTITSEALLDI